MVVATAMMALLSSQRANGCSVKTATKLETVRCAGHGVIARSRSSSVGLAGMLAIARLYCPENAMVNTHSSG